MAAFIARMPGRPEWRALRRNLALLLCAAVLLWAGLYVWQARQARRAVVEFSALLAGQEAVVRSHWSPTAYESLILRRLQQDPRSKRLVGLRTLGSAAWLTVCLDSDIAYVVELDGRRREVHITDMVRVDRALCRRPDIAWPER